jgi:uncharacterized membrane protein
LEKERQVKFLLYAGYAAAFATLSFVGTTILRIPIPASGGYFNLGDTFVMAAALLVNPLVGFFVGLVGPTVADAIGFPQFMLATCVVKSIEGLVVGLIGFRSKGKSKGRIVLALLAGAFILVAGYYAFEAYVYPALAQKVPFFKVTDKNAALAEIFPNSLQGLFSGMLALGIWMAFRGRKED